MGFPFKKKEVPDELPKLALDALGEDVSKEVSQAADFSKRENFQRSISSQTNSHMDSQKLPVSSSNIRKRAGNFSAEDEKGYFKELVKSVTEEIKDLDKLDSWYKNKFFPGDMVFQMREYWEKQHPELLLKNINGGLKNELLQKTDKLHQLEKEWQQIYFQLMEKEESIRQEEKELKETLSEFIKLYKQSMKRMNK